MKRIHHIALTFLLASLLLFSGACGGDDPIEINETLEDPAARVLDYLNRFTATKTPGIQYIALKIDGNRIEKIVDYAGGWQDIIQSEPMTKETTMNGYSMTKVITAIAVWQLVETGKIDIDRKISDFVPESPYTNGATVRQILSHTGGIPNPSPMRWVHLTAEHKDFNEDEALAEALAENNDAEDGPNEEYRYSNIGYWLLGRLIENVSGISYEEYVQKNILTPLAIPSSSLGFLIPDPENHAAGYLSSFSLINLIKGFLTDQKYFGEPENGWVRIHPHYLNGAPFGGLIGNAGGFAFIGADLLKENPTLLRHETIRQMLTQTVLSSGEPAPATPGWQTGMLDSTPFAFKEGGGLGYHSEMRIYPTRNLVSVIIVNKTMLNTRQTLNTIDGELFR